jgi:hypothetical protein
VLKGITLLSQVPGSFFYSTRGPLNLPFLNGKLCVAPPIHRLPASSTGGSMPSGSACNGALAIDFNTWIASGADPRLVAGQEVYVQVWFRDPGFAPPNDVGLSNALEFFILP